jgi:predicted DNA-binding protein
MNTISLKLPDDLLELLERESRTRRTTKSSLVRECLEKTLAGRVPDREATCYDLARDLAGSLKGLPPDLATNPKYLEGFPHLSPTWQQSHSRVDAGGMKDN